MSRLTARWILAIDAISCGLAALLAAFIPSAWRTLDLSARWHRSSHLTVAYNNDSYT